MTGHARVVERLPAEQLFFPLAAAYALLSVPLSLHGMLDASPLLPGFAHPLFHAHELLFGFALAVVTGYLVNRIQYRYLMLLAGVWLLARGLFLFMPVSLPAMVANLSFAAALVGLTAPPFLRAAKKPRNKLFGPLLIAIGLAVAAFHLLQPLGAAWQRAAIYQGLLLLALLLVVMGGRIIAPAVANATERAGGTLEARLQPRTEGALILLLLAALLVQPLPFARPLAGVLLLIAATLAAARLWRWQPWHYRQRPDLLCLLLGYAWLVAGLALLGIHWLTAVLSTGAALHALTIGGLGTLTATVMARVRLNRRKLSPANHPLLPIMVLALSGAAMLRIALPGSITTLWLSAALWSLAFTLLLVLLLRHSDLPGLLPSSLRQRLSENVSPRKRRLS
ncbi:NnrS family protein [Methylonatrum kenyense]|uniref:NnrS family protein n=1 Tax=Methylonatrum kenyense TaxID=455253 RepID=UPI0020C15342|nr:NnrS family protein [Methylonatrum kenyense]MCK8515870.1 NnrS family protein [Methylonatrum kenyense]